VAEQTVLHVLWLQGFSKQRIVLQVDHPDGEVVARSPVGVDRAQLVCTERIGDGSGSFARHWEPFGGEFQVECQRAKRLTTGQLDRLLRRAGCRERVTLLWNANNLFGFHRIAWSELARWDPDKAWLYAVLERLRTHPEEERALRTTARRTEKTFAGSEVVTRLLSPRVALLRSPRTLHARSIV
jgi:hypothetical protein